MKHEPKVVVIHLTHEQIAELDTEPVVLWPEPGIGKRYRYLTKDYDGNTVTVHVCLEDAPKPN